VSGENFWHFAVADGTTTLSAVAANRGDEPSRELQDIHTALYGEVTDEKAFFDEMIAEHRMVIRLQVEYLHGVLASGVRRRRS
jgi:hypothetical protein